MGQQPSNATPSADILWRPARFKGSTVWARIPTEDATTPYVSESTGKACVKYKDTPTAKWYWCTPELVILQEPGAEEEEEEEEAGARRSKRRRGPEAAAAAAAEEAERAKLPRHAENGKLYGVVAGNSDRREYVRGKDWKKHCAKCKAELTPQEYIGFIEATKAKSLRRTYGDDGRTWHGDFLTLDRQFFCLPCWQVPKSAQRSLRGLIDIHGFDSLPDGAKSMVQDLLPLVPDDQE